MTSVTQAGKLNTDTVTEYDSHKILFNTNNLNDLNVFLNAQLMNGL